MKNSFKSKCNHNKKVLGKIVFLTFILIILVTFFLLYKFNKNINKNLMMISEAETEKVTYNIITSKITNSLINKESVKDILIINKNNDGEILFVDFDLDKAYKLLDSVSLVLTDTISSLENGNIDIAYLNKDLTHKTNGIILNIPVGSVLNSNYFYNLGPKIPVKINYIGSVLTNLETKVTNYGLNNALVELFIYVEFHSEIVLPFRTKDIEIKYNAVVASMMIEGEVPSFYNGVIEKSSDIFTQNID